MAKPAADPELALLNMLLEESHNEFGQEVLDTEAAEERLAKP
jgi:hypothetical protein